MASRWLFRRLVAPIALVVACCSVAQTVRADDQDARIQALEKRLESSLQVIEKLSARVAELERGAKAAPPKPVPDGVPAPVSHAQEVARLQNTVDQISAGLSARDLDTGLPVHGFADVRAAWSSSNDPQTLRGFSVGTLDLYLTPQVSDRVKSLVEIAFEFDRDGNGSADMERLQLGYAVSDAMTLWAGRFHTPFGLWNTWYHHGANLQTSILRPRFVEFEDEGGIIPAHSVGLWANGKLRLSSGKATYDLYLSNGPSIRQRRLDPNSFTDDNSSKLLGFNLGYHPGGARDGLTFGIHGFGSTINAYSPADVALSKTQLRVAGAYFGYDADDWEVIGEYYHFANADAATGARRPSNMEFIHAGRAFGALTPYIRLERASLDPDDNYFRSQQLGRSYRRAIVGARYALDGRSSLKVEFSGTRESSLTQLDDNGAPVPFAGDGFRRAAVQYSIAF
jgi:hypothetical protein